MKRVVAFDVGSHTIGVAQSDVMKMFAHPVKTFRFTEHKWEQAITEILDTLNLSEIETYVIGLPKTLKNNDSESTFRAQRFAEKFEQMLTQKKGDSISNITFFDERFSTHSAENILLSADMKRKNRKKVIDTVAAVVILDNYLASIKSYQR